MPVPRALILAASASAVLAIAGCGGSDSSDQADTSGSVQPTVAATTAPDGSSPVAATTPCVLVGGAEAEKALPGSTLAASGSHACIYDKSPEVLEFRWVGKSEMTHNSGKYPELYTVFRKGAKDNTKYASIINFTVVDVGDTGYITSQYQTPQSNIRWISANGDLLSLKLTGFPKNESSRKAAVATLIATAKAVDAKQPTK